MFISKKVKKYSTEIKNLFYYTLGLLYLWKVIFSCVCPLLSEMSTPQCVAVFCRVVHRLLTKCKKKTNQKPKVLKKNLTDTELTGNQRKNQLN